MVCMSALLDLATRIESGADAAETPQIPLTANEANAVAVTAARAAIRSGASESAARRVFEDAYAEAISLHR